jgi:hypothetical protein
VNEDAICKAVLDPEREPIENRILRIAPCSIHVVQCQSDLFSKEFVIEHQQCSIEELEFVVPQDVKDFWFGCRRVANKLRIVDQDPGGFSYETCLGFLFASQIEKGHSGLVTKIKAIQVIVANELHDNPL